ncbi:MAG TPA: PDZ domain-containing protein [Pirellulales bacterium]|nr:PDZ domain-containing protein [Pirellulales bacterium]
MNCKLPSLMKAFCSVAVALAASPPCDTFAAQPTLATQILPANKDHSAAPLVLGLTLADDDSQGVRVLSVQAESPAAKARVQPGDRLLSVNGRSISTAAELIGLVRDGEPGARFKFQIDREGLQGSLWLVPEAKHDGLRDLVVRKRTGASTDREQAMLGVSLFDGTYTGVRVLSVAPDSPAAAAGFRAGDRILSINGETISQSGDVIALVASSRPGQTLNVRIDREGLQGSLSAVLAARRAVLSRPFTPARYRGPAEESERFYQAPTPGEISDQRSYGSG